MNTECCSTWKVDVFACNLTLDGGRWLNKQWVNKHMKDQIAKQAQSDTITLYIGFGCLRLALKEASGFQKDNEPSVASSDPKKIIPLVMSTLRKSRYVKEIREYDKEYLSRPLICHWQAGLLRDSPGDREVLTIRMMFPIVFDVELPPNKQVLLLPHEKSEKMTAQVLYDGEFFMMCCDKPSKFGTASSVRHLLEEILADNPYYYPTLSAPSPFRKYVRLSIYPNAPEGDRRLEFEQVGLSTSTSEVAEYFWDIPYVLSHRLANRSSDTNKECAALDLFLEVRTIFERFYRAMAYTEAISKTSREAEEFFSKVSESLAVFHEHSRFNFITRGRLSTKISAQLSGIYRTLVKYQQLLTARDEEIVKLDEDLKSRHYPDKLCREIINEAEQTPKAIMSTGFLEALRYAEAEIRAHVSSESILFAGIIGAITGASVYALLALILT
jgi:hypothetical protein